jgi:hypothetical protein
MLDNGVRVVIGAVAAHGGTVSVTTHRRRYELPVNSVTGLTEVRSCEAVPEAPGTAVKLNFLQRFFDYDDLTYGREAIGLAGLGTVYDGYSQPAWYNPENLLRLLAAAKRDLPCDVIDEVFGFPLARPIELTGDWADAFIARHISPVTGDDIGSDQPRFPVIITGSRPVLGRDRRGGDSVLRRGLGACRARGKDSYAPRTTFHPILNRSVALTEMSGHADSSGLRVHGSGIDFKMSGSKRAYYHI